MPPCREPLDEMDESHYDGGSADEDLCEVEGIRDKRKGPDGAAEYLVRYKGYTSDHDEWRSEADLAYCLRQLEAFEKSFQELGKRKSRPAPKSRRKPPKKELAQRLGRFECGDRAESIQLLETTEDNQLVFQVMWRQT